MDASDVAAVGMMAAAVGTTIWTIRNGRKGERKEEEQVLAAAKLAERVQGYDELAGYADRVEAQLTRAQDALVEQDKRHAAEMERLELSYDRRRDEQSERCRRELGAALDTVKTMHSIVTDEIAKSAALVTEDSVARHLSNDHPED